MDRALATLAESQPDLAFTKAFAITDSRTQGSALWSLIATSGSDFEKYGTFPAITAPEARQQILSGIGSVLSRDGMDAARGELDKFPPAEQRQIISAMIEQRVMQDVTSAAEWMETVPAQDWTPSEISNVIGNLARTDGARAFQMLLASGRMESDQTNGIRESVFGEYCKQDPEAAAADLGRFPAGKLRQEATRQLLAVWPDWHTP